MKRLLIFLVTLLLIPALPAMGANDLQALIDAAKPGSVLIVPSGTYDGGVIIDKPLEIRGDGWPVIDGHGSGTVVIIDAPDVSLTGLVIANSGDSLSNEHAAVWVNAPRARIVGNRLENVLFGLFLRGAEDSLVADNVIGSLEREVQRRGDGIRLWESSRTVVQGNVVDGGRDTVLWFSDDLVLRDNRVSNGRYGIHFMYSDRALVERNYLTSNSVGGFLMYSKDLTLRDNLITNNQGPSGYGIGLKEMDGIVVEGNHLLSNRVGIYFDNSPSMVGLEHKLTDNVFAYNRVGALFLPSVRGNVLTGNSFIDNGEQVGVQGSGEFYGHNSFTEGDAGNYWSDFAGYDANGDGIGDVPYEIADLFSSLTDDNPDLRFFDQTPASKAIDLAGHMFPAFRPRPKVTDTAPLIEAPSNPSPIDVFVPSSALATAIPSLAMLALAAGLWLVSRSPLRRVAR